MSAPEEKGRTKLSERAWLTFKQHQRHCKVCYDLGGFVQIAHIEHGDALPDEQCDTGRGFMVAWLASLMREPPYSP